MVVALWMSDNCILFTINSYFFVMRKTRKFPNMFGSPRKHKKDLAFAKRFSNWQDSVFVDSKHSISIDSAPGIVSSLNV